MINQKNYYTSVSLVAQILILRPESVEGRNAAAVLLSFPDANYFMVVSS